MDKEKRYFYEKEEAKKYVSRNNESYDSEKNSTSMDSNDIYNYVVSPSPTFVNLIAIIISLIIALGSVITLLVGVIKLSMWLEGRGI